MDRLVDLREVFSKVVTTRAGCEHNDALVSAFAKVPRHEFVGPGPWVVSEDGDLSRWDDPAMLYHDLNVGLLADIPTGLPSLHAMCLDACELQPASRVVHVGAGAGYYTAILAELVGDRGRVDAYEIEARLAARATANLRPWPQAVVHDTSGVTGFRFQVDLIYVNAGVQQIPRAWIDALALGGKLLVPLVPGRDEGGLFLVTRRARSSYSASYLSPARFVPCIGAAVPDVDARLAKTFERGGAETVRSLRVSCEPDESAWFAGHGWWLSTAEIA